jgi:ubiquinone/menaquinone biosynthesis C-methylase UbiE
LRSIVTGEQLQTLHRGSTQNPSEIARILAQLIQSRLPLRRGLNRRIEPEIAYLEEAAADELIFLAQGFEWVGNERQILLSFDFERRGYVFAAALRRRLSDTRFATSIPLTLYHKERRDCARRKNSQRVGSATRVMVCREDGDSVEGYVVDESLGGLGLRVPPLEAGKELRVRFLDGERAGSEIRARVCHSGPVEQASGWLRLGIDTSGLTRSPLPAELLDRSVRSGIRRALGGLRDRTAFIGAKALQRAGIAVSPKPEIRAVRFHDRHGREIAALIDTWGPTRGAVAVIIPPAWGRTKETLVGLAQTVVATFAGARQPVVVVRFDGIGKRGESYREPSCRAVGSEHHRFTFSQGVRDILSTLEFLETSEELQPSGSILVTFSAASLDGRKAVAEDGGRRVRGWVSVVGSADLQSMMRVVSGGVDYVAGAAEGLTFGLQEVLGVEVNIDLAARDAFAHGLAYIDDSRRDFERIFCPVTWFHGAHDAWMDLERVRDVMAHGDSARRRLVLVPMGHQMRNSMQAMEVFKMIASEVGVMALGRRVHGRSPQLTVLEERMRLERERVRHRRADLRSFWHDYLLGKDETVGIELMSWSSAYRGLMEVQVEALQLTSGQRVLDLGCGVGPFALHLAADARTEPVTVVGCDFVMAALLRARRILAETTRGRPCFEPLQVDVAANAWLPLRKASMDAVLASLFLSYVSNPRIVLQDLRRVLKPGGRLVLSCLRKDADISKIFREGLDEIRRTYAARGLSRSLVERASRGFLNEAARLIDYEEQGLFAFWEEDELRDLVSSCGYSVLRVDRAFGAPPQAVVLAAQSTEDA